MNGRLGTYLLNQFPDYQIIPKAEYARAYGAPELKLRVLRNLNNEPRARKRAQGVVSRN